MQFRRSLVIACLLVGLIPAPKQSYADVCAGKNSGFVERDGAQFCFQGKPLVLYGAAFYPFWQKSGNLYRSLGWLREDFKEYIDLMIEYAKAANLNTLRATNFLDTVYYWNYPILWDNMDYLIQQAQAQNMWVILDFTTYREWLREHGFTDIHNADNWKPFIQFVAERYRDNTGVAYYSISSEIPDRSETGASEQEYEMFFRQLLEEIHTTDSGKHLISVGGLSYLDYDSGIPWRILYSLPYNSIAAIHVYSEGDRAITLPAVSAWAEKNDMPLLIQEFGSQQQIGDQERADYYQSMYDLARTYDASGVLFWNLGPELASVSHDVGPDTPLVWNVIRQNAP